MKPLILSYVMGPLENNCFVLVDPESNSAVIFDPSFDCDWLLADLQARKIRLEKILLTHAHFDHIAGVAEIARTADPILPVGLHAQDLALYQNGGDAAEFGFAIEPGPLPQIQLVDGQDIMLGSIQLRVLYAPGHTPGHVVFYCPAAGAAFCGDVIFAGSVGRTDLAGGDQRVLLASIRKQILTLPPETRLLCGHGPETTVSEESRTNPFLV